MKNTKLVQSLIFGLVTLVVVGLLTKSFYTLWRNRQNPAVDTQLSGLDGEVTAIKDVILTAEVEAVNPDGSVTINILGLELADRSLSGLDLRLSFDPQQLSVDDIEIGDRWDKSTEVVKKIDNSTGQIGFVSVQGIGSIETLTPIVAVITVQKATGVGEVEINVETGSNASVRDPDELVGFIAGPLVLSLGNTIDNSYTDLSL